MAKPPFPMVFLWFSSAFLSGHHVSTLKFLRQPRLVDSMPMPTAAISWPGMEIDLDEIFSQ